MKRQGLSDWSYSILPLGKENETSMVIINWLGLYMTQGSDFLKKIGQMLMPRVSLLCDSAREPLRSALCRALSAASALRPVPAWPSRPPSPNPQSSVLPTRLAELLALPLPTSPMTMTRPRERARKRERRRGRRVADLSLTRCTHAHIYELETEKCTTWAMAYHKHIM